MTTDKMPVPLIVQIPQMTPDLLNPLLSRARWPNDCISWNYKVGDRVKEEATIAVFRLQWSWREKRQPHKSLRDKILSGAMIMPFDGIITDINLLGSHSCMFAFRPCVANRDITGDWNSVSKWIKSVCDPYRVYEYTTKAVYMAYDQGQNIDSSDIIDAELEKMETAILEQV